MSTRYVWGRYNRQSSTSYTTRYRAVSESVGSFSFSMSQGQTFSMGTGYTISSTTGTLSLTGSSTYTIALGSFGSGYVKGSDGCVYYGSWTGSYAGLTGFYLKSSSTTKYSAESYQQSSTSYSQGTYIDDVSNASSSYYPTNSYSGTYWYVYQGSDNIDPSAVTLPDTIMGGASTTVTVTPSSSKVYGGTVSYTYQYKLDDGDWQTLATTSETSQSLVVPSGTTTITVQVRAADNLGFTSSTWVSSDTKTVTNNIAPSAPGSIAVTNVLSGQQATITLTEATDSDGTIESYIYERQVDGGEWEQFADVNSLTQTDTIDESWGTVAYRAKAVDDDGAEGPYVTSETYTVNSGWITIGGPSSSDLGTQSGPFTLTLNIGVSGVTGVSDIAVTAVLDDETIYDNEVSDGDSAVISIDPRTMGAGEHTIRITASHDGYLSAALVYTFTVPAIDIPSGGYMVQAEDDAGIPVFFVTTTRAVIGPNGQSAQTQLDNLRNATKGITGHFELVDALVGPVTAQEIDREENTVYTETLFGGTSGGGNYSIPSTVTSGTYGAITVSSDKLSVTLSSTEAVMVYKYVLDVVEDTSSTRLENA